MSGINGINNSNIDKYYGPKPFFPDENGNAEKVPGVRGEEKQDIKIPGAKSDDKAEIKLPGVKEDKSEIKLPGAKEEEPAIVLPGSDKGDGRVVIKGEGDGPDGECETCKNRKYKDGSDEMVSFKSPGHISPQASAAVVRGHEQEHVSNAFEKAATGNGKVISATVSLRTSICPECGRSYVSGGVTNTQIKYYNEENPYQQELKSADKSKYEGLNLNLGG